MTQFVRFNVDNLDRFESLQQVFTKIQSIKNLDLESTADNLIVDYDLDRMRDLMPAEVRSNFIWPTTADELESHKLDKTQPLAIAPPGAFLGERWSLVRILDLIDRCEYSLARCDLVNPQTGEMHVDTWGYPYGGLNALIALIEGFGFEAIGVNECGGYEEFG
jgi:hypothetical protein